MVPLIQDQTVHYDEADNLFKFGGPTKEVEPTVEDTAEEAMDTAEEVESTVMDTAAAPDPSITYSEPITPASPAVFSDTRSLGSTRKNAHALFAKKTEAVALNPGLRRKPGSK